MKLRHRTSPVLAAQDGLRWSKGRPTPPPAPDKSALRTEAENAIINRCRALTFLRVGRALDVQAGRNTDSRGAMAFDQEHIRLQAEIQDRLDSATVIDSYEVVSPVVRQVASMLLRKKFTDRLNVLSELSAGLRPIPLRTTHNRRTGVVSATYRDGHKTYTNTYTPVTP